MERVEDLSEGVGGLPPTDGLRYRLAGDGRRVVAIPGNHDIPYTFPKRFTAPWREFERLWETTEPSYRSDGLFVPFVSTS